MGSFSTQPFALRSHGGSILRKEFGKSESQKSKKHQESFISGPKSRFLDYNIGQKSGLNKIRHVPGPRTPLKKYVL